MKLLNLSFFYVIVAVVGTACGDAIAETTSDVDNILSDSRFHSSSKREWELEEMRLEAVTLVPTVSPTVSVIPSAIPSFSFQPTVSSAPSISFQPTVNPTRKPTRKPTQKPSIGIYGEHPNVYISKFDQQAIVGTLTCLLFIMMAMEFWSPEILFMIALIIVMLCQILTLTETLSGFANESMITIGTLFLVIGAVEKSHIVDYFARKAFGMTGSHTMAMTRMYLSCFCLAIFFNNTPLIAILMPVVKDWGRVRNISASQLLIPLSYTVLAGSFISMIGTSTNLTVQGLMQADRGYSFTFFAPAPIGGPMFVLILIYQIVAGPYLLPNHKNGLLRAVRDKAESLIAEVFVSRDSPYVGKNLETMMNALGIAPSRAIKIRRKVRKEGDDAETLPAESKTLHKSASSGLFDLNYIKSHIAFWAPAPPSAADNANSNGYSAQATDDTPVDIEFTADMEDGSGTATLADKKAEYVDIIAPSAMELIGAEDVVFMSSAQDVMHKLMKSIAGESKGLYILDSNVLALPGYGSELVEMVISDTNPFIGKTVGEMGAGWNEKYKAAIITARGKDWINSEHSEEENEGTDKADEKAVEHFDAIRSATVAAPKTVGEEGDIELTNLDSEKLSHDEGVEGESAKPLKGALDGIHTKVISDHVLHTGDVVLCVTSDKHIDGLKANRDFFVVSTVGALPTPISYYAIVPVVIFIVMLILVANELIDMCPAALTVTVVFFMGGWITYDEIPKLVDMRLLMLMGCSLSFAKSMTKSGLAVKIAEGVASGAPSNYEALVLIYVVTLIITELISNNAAAALMYPIAVALADQLGADFKPFAMGVLVASTAGFMSPIGYQCHVMVWGPGGYKFKDFLIFGLVPDVLYWIVGCALIQAAYPF